MHLIFHPAVNYVLRHAMRPFARVIPPDFHPRVNGTFEVELEPGRTFRIAVNPTSYLGKVLFFRGVEGYEWNVVRLFAALARQARTFLDIGANIGYYTLVAATVNPELRIVAFEPMPGPRHFLEKNAALNGCRNVTVSPLALSEAAGEAEFFFAKDPTFLDVEHHLTTTGGFNESLSSRTHVVERFEVPTDTLDHYAAAHLAGAELDLLKLDTESSEHLVLRGGEAVLRVHHPTIFCEVLPDTIEAELEGLLQPHGYRFFRAVEAGLVETDHLRHGDRALKEHVFVHPSRMDAVRPFLAGGR